MKKISIALMVIVVFLAGCISFQVGDTERELVAKIAARHVGFEVQKRYPDVAIEVLEVSNDILAVDETNITSSTVDRIVSALTDEVIDDQLLAMGIQDLVGMIRVQVDVEITEDQMAIIRTVVESLIEGIELGK
jgi:hypothetical protein